MTGPRVDPLADYSPDWRSPNRDLGALVPQVADSARSLIAAAKAAGVDLKPIETRRSQQRQDSLYAQGRTRPGDQVTWTLHSNHTPGAAIDFLANGDMSGNDPGYRWLQENAAKFGFGVLGSKDPGHVEMPGAVPHQQQVEPDFSDVQGGSSTRTQPGPDFSDVQGGSSTAAKLNPSVTDFLLHGWRDPEDFRAHVEARHARPGVPVAGNIDLSNRPRVKNPDGSISTVRSISIGEDGKEILIPTVSPDGRILSDNEAVDLYHRTGQHLGKFANVAQADSAANAIHDQQARAIQKPTPEEFANVIGGHSSSAPKPAQSDPLAGYSPDWRNGKFAGSFAPSSTATAPNQTARRAEQANRPFLEKIDLPFGVQRDVNQAAQGASFGFSDEALAGLRSLLGEKYADAVKSERAGLAQFSHDHPTRAFLDEFAGGLATTGGAAKTAAKGAVSAGARILRGAAMGATAGGVAGAGKAEGGIGERAKGAGEGAAWGAGIGGVLGGVGAGLAARGAKATGQEAADEALSRSFGRDSKSVDDVINAAKQFSDDKPAVVLDVAGKNTQRLGRAVRTQPSEGSAKIEEMLNGRTQGAEERTINDVIQTTGLGRDDAFKAADQLVKDRSANAQPAYQKVLANAAPISPDAQQAFAKLLDTREFRMAWKDARELAKDEGHTLPKIQKAVQKPSGVLDAQGNPVMTTGYEFAEAPDIRSVDYMKRVVDDVIQGRMKSGPGAGGISRARGSMLIGKKNDFLALIDKDRPEYGAARGQFADDSRLIDAYDLGRNLFKMHPDEIAQQVDGMGPSEKLMVRRGGVSVLGDRIEARATGRDPGAVADKTLDRKRLRLLFDDDASYQDFQKKLGEEAQMHRTRIGITGNSQTADKIAEFADMGGVPIEALMHGATGNFAGAGKALAKTQIVRYLMARVQGINEQKANDLADRMTQGVRSRQDLLDMLDRIKQSSSAHLQRSTARAAVITSRTNRLGAGASNAALSPAPDVRNP